MINASREASQSYLQNSIIKRQLVLVMTVKCALQFPSRNLQEAGVHGHFFVNGGNLSLLSGTNRSIQQTVSEDFVRNWRWTTVCSESARQNASTL